MTQEVFVNKKWEVCEGMREWKGGIQWMNDGCMKVEDEKENHEILKALNGKYKSIIIVRKKK